MSDLQVELVNFIDDQNWEKFLLLFEEINSRLKLFELLELLFRACRFGTLPMVKKVLEANVLIDVNSRHSSTRYSPLFIAIRAQQHDIIQYLIRETDADINSRFPKNRTCLHEALRRGDLSTVTLLLDRQVDVDQSHLFLIIIECLRGEIIEPLILFEKLISSRPELLEGQRRQQVIDFILHRATWPAFHHSNCVIPLLQRLSSNDIPHQLTNGHDHPSSMKIHRTQVGIIGAGPAGLILAALLYEHGIDSIIIERHCRTYVESNIRAGVLEQSTIDLLDNIDTSTHLFRKGCFQRDILLQFDGEQMTLPLAEMTDGKGITIYGQHYLLQDLIRNRLHHRQRLWFEIEEVHIEQVDSNPRIRFRRHDQLEWEEIHCDFIGGCDGANSDCCRSSIPNNLLQKIERIHPFSWLSLLVESPPEETKLLYSNHSKHGFALRSFRSLTHTRYHLQVSSEDTFADWPDERIWRELSLRLKPANQPSWTINQGPIVQRAIFPIRNIVHSPMQYKRLYLLGDAAHIFPPTGAKGLNVAARDATIFAEALIDFYENNSHEKLDHFTDICLNYVWKIQEFTTYMTFLLHNMTMNNEDLQSDKLQFDVQIQKIQRQMFQESHALQLHLAQMIAH